MVDINVDAAVGSGYVEEVEKEVVYEDDYWYDRGIDKVVKVGFSVVIGDSVDWDID